MTVGHGRLVGNYYYDLCRQAAPWLLCFLKKTEISLGKANILLPIAATSTISTQSLFRVLGFGSIPKSRDKLCYLIQRGPPVLIASVCSSYLVYPEHSRRVSTDNVVLPLRRSDYFRWSVTQPTLASYLAWGNYSLAYGTATPSLAPFGLFLLRTIFAIQGTHNVYKIIAPCGMLRFIY
jgi:hypothetical protein